MSRRRDASSRSADHDPLGHEPLFGSPWSRLSPLCAPRCGLREGARAGFDPLAGGDPQIRLLRTIATSLSRGLMPQRDSKRSRVRTALLLATALGWLPTVSWAQDSPPIPDHAHSGFGDRWQCDRGFKRDGDQCVEIQVPEHAFLALGGAGWRCERGFRRIDDRCDAIQLPKHAFLSHDGNAWECERGFKHVDNRCEELHVPEHAYLESSGDVGRARVVFSTSAIGARRSASLNTHTSSTREIVGSATKGTSVPRTSVRPSKCLRMRDSTGGEMAGRASRASGAPATAVFRSDDPWRIRGFACGSPSTPRPHRTRCSRRPRCGGTGSGCGAESDPEAFRQVAAGTWGPRLPLRVTTARAIPG